MAASLRRFGTWPPLIECRIGRCPRPLRRKHRTRMHTDSQASARAVRPRATSVVLFLLCLMYAITYIDRVNVSTAAAAFREELHLTNTQVGLVFSAFAYPYLIF